eukprot:3881001-Prymnesium_polylepis.1
MPGPRAHVPSPRRCVALCFRLHWLWLPRWPWRRSAGAAAPVEDRLCPRRQEPVPTPCMECIPRRAHSTERVQRCSRGADCASVRALRHDASRCAISRSLPPAPAQPKAATTGATLLCQHALQRAHAYALSPACCPAHGPPARRRPLAIAAGARVQRG